MNSRIRFHQTMQYGAPDRPPYFEEGIREEVLLAWRGQGMPADMEIGRAFPSDPRWEIQPDIEPRPSPEVWPVQPADIEHFRGLLRADDPERLPPDWSERRRSSEIETAATMLRVHRGFFLSMGVYDWKRFADVIRLLTDEPEVVRAAMAAQAEFAADLAERILSEVRVDAAVYQRTHRRERPAPDFAGHV